MPWYIHINYYIFSETKQSIFMLSFKHPDYISGIAEFWYFLQSWTGTGQPSLGQEQAQGWKHPLSVFAANIRTSEHNVGLAYKLKHNIAHKYLSLFEYAVLEYKVLILTSPYKGHVDLLESYEHIFLPRSVLCVRPVWLHSEKNSASNISQLILSYV